MKQKEIGVVVGRVNSLRTHPVYTGGCNYEATTTGSRYWIPVTVRLSQIDAREALSKLARSSHRGK